MVWIKSCRPAPPIALGFRIRVRVFFLSFLVDCPGNLGNLGYCVQEVVRKETVHRQTEIIVLFDQVIHILGLNVHRGTT